MFSVKKNVYKYLLPNLLETQRISFCWFLELGFVQELENFSVIRDYLDELELNLSARFYKIRQPKYTLAEAKRRDTTYSVRVYTRGQLLYLNSDNTTENDVLLCDIP
jgi:DNA-directed RNA polymerase subunit beta